MPCSPVPLQHLVVVFLPGPLNSPSPPLLADCRFTSRTTAPPTNAKKKAYVKQEDVFYSQLTVRETLLMAARLRLPRSMSLEDKTAMVDKLISKLGLSKVGLGEKISVRAAGRKPDPCTGWVWVRSGTGTGTCLVTNLYFIGPVRSSVVRDLATKPLACSRSLSLCVVFVGF